MTEKFVALQVRAEKAVEQRLMDRRAKGDAGQGTLEYIGAILIAAVIVGLVYAAVSQYQVGDKVKSAIDKVFSSAGG